MSGANDFLNRRLGQRLSPIMQDYVIGTGGGDGATGLGGYYVVGRADQLDPQYRPPGSTAYQDGSWPSPRSSRDPNGGGGPYDEEKSMPMPGGGGSDGGRLPPAAYRGGRNKMIADYLMDAGAQGGANGFLNDRLMNRVSPAQGNPMIGSVKLQEFIAQYGREPETDMEMMMVFGGDGSPSPSPRAGIARELMRK